METLISIRETTNYSFSLDEICFILNSSKGKVKSLLETKRGHMPENLTVGLLDMCLVKLTLTPNDKLFTQSLQQVSMRLIQHIGDIKPQRKETKTGISYPKLHRGALSLIKTFCTVEQKQIISHMMEKSKWNPSWPRADKAAWSNAMATNIGQLPLASI